MATDSTVLREYLVSLGFKIDQPGAKKVDQSLERWDKRATNLTKSLFGVTSAAALMATQFAHSMEKLYYASRRTDSAVGNIQALDYAARKVGVSSGTIQGALESLARNLRSNPGLTGLLESLGVPVKGRDKADVLTDLVTQLKKMPPYIGQQYASLFGIDPDTLFMLQDGLKDFKEAQEIRKQMAKDMGVDADAAAKASRDYANQWRDIAEYAGIFRDAVMISALPAMNELAGVTKEVLKDWTAIAQMSSGEFWDKIKEGLGLKPVGGGVKLTDEAKARIGEVSGDNPQALNPGVKKKNWLTSNIYDYSDAAPRMPAAKAEDKLKTAPAQWLIDRFPGAFPKSKTTAQLKAEAGIVDTPAGVVSPPPSGVRVDNTNNKGAALFEKLEKNYDLPKGVLDRIWKAESNRGDPQYMLSPKGAKGHFGFMDDTAKEVGVTDPNDLGNSAAGAAKYYSQLLKKYGGDERKAAAAYNWGMGNVDRYGLGAAPKETQKYMDKVGGPEAGGATLEQTNHITIVGATDPQGSKRAVTEAMDQVNAEAIRNLTPRVQ